MKPSLESLTVETTYYAEYRKESKIKNKDTEKQQKLALDLKKLKLRPKTKHWPRNMTGTGGNGRR